MQRLSILTTLASTLALTACGGVEGDPTGPGGTLPPRELPVPALRMVAPTAVRAGEDVTIMGQGFADKQIGQVRLTFEGIYQNTAGKTNQVKLEVVPAWKNQGQVVWNFGPNIPFSPEGETGVFRGVLKAKNVGYDGTEKVCPKAIGVEMQVLPSILVRQMRPLTAGCPAGITATTADSKFLFEFKAVGLKAGSKLAPLRFVYTFLKENFNFSGYLSNQLATDPESLFPKSGPVSVVDDVHNGSISTLGTGVPRNMYVYKGVPGNLSGIVGGADNLFGMTYLKTAPTSSVTGNYASDYFDATMNVIAIDSSGQRAKRTVRLRVWAPVEIKYDGSAKPVRTFDPVPVSGCIPGGDIGRDVTYSEATSETRQREFTVTGKVSGGFDIKVVRLNAEFGVEVNASVSSSKSKDLKITGKILPKQFGVFYRQTIQLERVGNLVGHGPCGSSQDLGQVIVTDWVWSPDLAKSMGCPPLPPSNLSAGQIFKP